MVVLLPGIVCPPCFQSIHLWRHQRATRAKPEAPNRRVRDARKKRCIFFGAAAVGVIAVSLYAFYALDSGGPPVQPLEENEGSLGAPGGKRPGGIEGAPLLQKPVEWLLGRLAPEAPPPRSLLGLLPIGLRRFLTSSESLPFSPERPHQLHFVTFRRSKVTAASLLSDSSSPGGSRSSSNSSGSNNRDEELANGENATAGSAERHIRFTPDLEPLVTSHRTAHLVRRSTQGIAILGLGSPAFWNPASLDAGLILAAIRDSVAAAEEAAAAPGPLRGSACSSPTGAADAATAVPSSPSNNETDAVSTVELAGQGAFENVALRGRSCGIAGASVTSSSPARSSPSFQVKEEPPSQNAPLTLAHLHRLSTSRTHWSVYTDAKVILGS